MPLIIMHNSDFWLDALDTAYEVTKSVDQFQPLILNLKYLTKTEVGFKSYLTDWQRLIKLNEKF